MGKRSRSTRANVDLLQLSWSSRIKGRTKNKRRSRAKIKQNKMSQAINKGSSFFKRLVNDRPDLVFGFGVLMIGTIGAIFKEMRYDEHMSHQHRFEYTVIRKGEEDPVAAAKGCFN